MYTYNKKVLFSDLDATQNMSVGSMMDAMQDCVNINSESIGRGISYMLENKRTWFAISWNIEIKRFPGKYEELLIKTWPYDFSTSIGYRNIIVEDQTGEAIVCADSMWTLMDLNSGRPARIEEEDVKGYDLEERYPMEKLGRKIKLPKDFEQADVVKVQKADIDYNGHMSNARYIILAHEYLPEEVFFDRIRVEYKNQARYGEELIVSRAVQSEETGESRVVISISGKETLDVKAIVDFRLKGE